MNQRYNRHKICKAKGSGYGIANQWKRATETLTPDVHDGWIDSEDID